VREWRSGTLLSIEKPRGVVEMWALGEDHFRITAPGHEQLVTGFDEAERAADALAERREYSALGLVPRVDEWETVPDD
jgi:hypothetical protein